MKNSPRHNPTKDVAAPSKQKQQWPANRAGTCTPPQTKSGKQPASRSIRQPATEGDSGIKSSKHFLEQQDNAISASAAHGNNDLMSEEKTLLSEHLINLVSNNAIADPFPF